MLKLKTRLIIAFITMITFPVLLTSLAVVGFGHYQMRAIEKTYGITGATYESFSNPLQIFNRLTASSYHELTRLALDESEKLEDVAFLESFNTELQKKKSYMLVRKDKTIIFIGEQIDKTEMVMKKLPLYDSDTSGSEDGIYLGGEAQALLKQVDFRYGDGDNGSAFIVTPVGKAIPEFKELTIDIMMATILTLVLTASLLILWIYRGVAGPIVKMQNAANNIKEGNLDFELVPETDDELGMLCQNFEEMRKRLQDNAEEKLRFDKENKELISNISHDLKTPITAIKGYAEGIIDGVADTPEKRDKYIRTIYNKANEMERLINELTFYSKIDTNRIPYNFATIPVADYFEDCAEDLRLELSAKESDSHILIMSMRVRKLSLMQSSSSVLLIILFPIL